MIRTNLATRPFYNERAVFTWLALVALVVVAATIYNVTGILRYSRSDTQLASEASRDETRATELRQQAARLRATVDSKQLDLASVEARQANDLIDQRTFSWTELFNRFETTLPNDARIVAVRPQIDQEKGFLITVLLQSREVQEIDQFMERLRGTGAFSHITPVEDHTDDHGQLVSTIEMRYVPAPSKPASGGGGAAAR